MGFFDKLDEIFDTKKAYSEDDLKIYFKHEIDGSYNTHIGKTKTTTNISSIVLKSIKEKYPEMNVWYVENGYTDLEKINENIFKIKYKGKIVRMKDVYGDALGDMYYDISVYANKYAELVSHEEYKTTVKVW